MSIPDNDVKALYKQISELKAIAVRNESRITKLEKALATVIINQQNDYKLLKNTANCLSSLDGFLSIVKNFVNINFDI
ncbi:hypothetical protein RIVM261_013160 [Rivularia sp. IAM M-261]|nr:hypothetical protein RIVM261_013160 [Rivularia sp. IAM M-261]